MIFLRARIRQERVGKVESAGASGRTFRDLDEQSYDDLQRALDTDKAGAYDFHLAYREVYRYLRNFESTNSKKYTHKTTPSFRSTYPNLD